jgi:FkbM family methyltransferase
MKITRNNFFPDKFDGFLVEVGAFNGINWSPSPGFIKDGWHACLIEPNPVSYYECVKNWEGNNNVQFRNCAVSDYVGAARLYIGGSLSTLKKERVSLYNDLKKSEIKGWGAGFLSEDKYTDCWVYTLDHILAEIDKKLDFLVIDAEGCEKEVLAGFSIDKHSPSVVMIKTHAQHEERRLAENYPFILDYFKNHGYTLHSEDDVNSVFVK